MNLLPNIRAAFGLALGAALFVNQANAEQPAVVGYTLVSSKIVGRTTTEFTYRLRIMVYDSAWTDVQYRVQSASPATTVMDDVVAFPTITSLGEVQSADTFTIRHDRRVPFDPALLTWKFHGVAFTPETVPNGWLSIRALEDADGDVPTIDADVFVNGNFYGKTDANGRFTGRVPVGDPVQVQVIDQGVVGAYRDLMVTSGDSIQLDLVLKSEAGLHEPGALTVDTQPGPGLSPVVESLVLTVTREPSATPVALVENRILQIHYEDGDTPAVVTHLFALKPDGRLELQDAAALRALLGAARQPSELSIYGEDERGRIFEVGLPIGP